MIRSLPSQQVTQSLFNQIFRHITWRPSLQLARLTPQSPSAIKICRNQLSIAAAMPTRAAAARETAFIASSVAMPPYTVKQGKKSNRAASTKATTAKSKATKAKVFGSGDGLDEGDVPEDDIGVLKTIGVLERENGSSVDGEAITQNNAAATSLPRDSAVLPTPAPSVKRTRVTPTVKKSSADRKPPKGGWDELPHNMGTTNWDDAKASDQENEDATETEESAAGPSKKRAKRAHNVTNSDAKGGSVEGDAAIKLEEATESKLAPKKKSGRGRAKKGEPTTPESEDVKADPITNELIGEIKDENFKDKKPKKQRVPRSKTVETSVDVQKKVGELLETVDKPVKMIKKGKKNPYGLTPGVSPFPEFAKPTVEDCHTVNDLLAEVHGKVVPPKEIPAPSLEVTGCGEVPSVLDALIRTRLSASTTSTNAGYAFTGLVERYGILKEGIGAGSVDWNKVRESDVRDIETAIKKGGLAATKSKSIKAILEMVYKHNVTRCDSFIAERDSGIASKVLGAEKLTQGQRDLEIKCRETGVLSLDYMHGLTADDAMIEFLQYPGIGVKTASCVILFCMRRPSFAVDTHVFRLCKWLGWVPENATRDTAFSHCEVRVPHELKYPLHQLLIRHGKTCGRCRAITGENSEGWEDANCPIEHLVQRTGLRKGPSSAKKASAWPSKAKNMKKTASKNGKKGKKSEEWDGDSDMDDEPELDDEEEQDGNDDSELSELEE